MRLDHDGAETSPKPGGIEPIPSLPIYLKLAGRRALLAGGSQAAVWKLDLLAAAGAALTVCDESPCPELVDAARRLGPAVTLLRRTWQEEDLRGCAIAVGALEGEQAVRFRDAARKAGVPVNIVDDPDLCDFQFGTIVARPPLLIGISTDGAAPVFGQALRTRVEALLPSTVGAWAQAAKAWRPGLQERRFSFAARRRFWENFSRLALDGTGRMPTDADRDACLAAANGVAAEARGDVLLVGIGSGDPDLVTIGAIRALQTAEVIVHAKGICPEILALGRREARRLIEREAERESVAAIAKLAADGQTVAWAGLGQPSGDRVWKTRARQLSEAGLRVRLVGG